MSQPYRGEATAGDDEEYPNTPLPMGPLIQQALTCRIRRAGGDRTWGNRGPPGRR